MIINTIATWQCKCGTKVKVIAETDYEQQQICNTSACCPMTAASCPQCGNEIQICADRIHGVFAIVPSNFVKP